MAGSLQKSTFTLSNFKSEIKSGGIARNNRFEVILIPPVGVTSQSYDPKAVSIRCHSAFMPEATVNVKQFKDGQSANFYSMPTGVSGGHETTLEFYNSSNYNEYAFFMLWLSLVKRNTSMGAELSYYNEYIGEIEIRQLDENNNIRFSCSLMEAYPTQVESIHLRSDDNDTAQLVRVKVAYRYWIPNMNSLTGRTLVDATPKTFSPAINNKRSTKSSISTSYTTKHKKGSGYDASMDKPVATISTGKGKGYDYTKEVITQTYTKSAIAKSAQHNWPYAYAQANDAYATGNTSVISSAQITLAGIYQSIKTKVSGFFSSAGNANRSYNENKSDIPSSDSMHSQINVIKQDANDIGKQQTIIDYEYNDINSKMTEALA